MKRKCKHSYESLLYKGKMGNNYENNHLKVVFSIVWLTMPWYLSVM